MRHKLKLILSILSIGLFILLAYASDLLDESSNVAVRTFTCEPRPPFTGVLSIEVQYLDSDNTPFEVKPNGNLFVVHQVIVDTMTCEYVNLSNDIIPFTLNSEGKFIYATDAFMHDNLSDLFRIEVKIKFRAYNWEGMRIMKTANYNQTYIQIKEIEPDED